MSLINLEAPAVTNSDGRLGLSRIRTVGLDFFDNVQATGYLSEDDVFAVQPGGIGSADEELRTVRVGSCVGHAESPQPTVGQLEIFILKSSSVNAASTRSIAVCEISSLTHESGNDAVKGGSLVSVSLFGGLAELLEVFYRPGYRRPVQTHLNAAGISSIDGNVKKDGISDFGVGLAAS